MLTPEPSQINWQAFLLFITFYSVGLYCAIKYFSNQNSDNAKDL